MARPGDVNRISTDDLRIGRPHPPRRLPEEFAGPLRGLAVFGFVGGFLTVATAAGLSIPIPFLIRAIVSGVAWTALSVVGGAIMIVGGYLIGHSLADGFPIRSPALVLTVGTSIVGFFVGLGLAIIGVGMTKIMRPQ